MEELSSEPEILARKPKGKPLFKPEAKCCPMSSTIPDASPERRIRGQVGRPSKQELQDRDFSAHVYIEIANPPKLHRGKTHKTDKFVPQDPTTEGPFTFTHDMSWKSFMSQVAELAELEGENITLTQMTWHFQGKTKSLPLGSFGGFTAMVTQIRALKVGATAIVMLGIPVPTRPSRRGCNAPADSEDVDQIAGSDAGDGRMWNKKVCGLCHGILISVLMYIKAQSR